MSRVPAVALGRTGLRVSRLGFGTYDFGVASLRIRPEEGGRILAEAHRLGVTYWDTSDDYGSHPHVAAALARVPRKEVVVSTKTDPRTASAARRSLHDSLVELGTEYLDVFLLHHVTRDNVRRARAILRELADEKASGRVRALGLSTHSPVVVRAAAGWEEADVLLAIASGARPSVVRAHPEEIPLEDGTMDAMFGALRLAHTRGKGILGMKVLGTGLPSLVEDVPASFGAIARLDFVDAVLVGMRNLDELRENVAAFRAVRRPGKSLGRRR